MGVMWGLDIYKSIAPIGGNFKFCLQLIPRIPIPSRGGDAEQVHKSKRKLTACLFL